MLYLVYYYYHNILTSSLFLQILDAVNMPGEFNTTQQKVINVILPSKMRGGIGEGGRSTSMQKVSQVEIVLHDIMPKVISSGDKEEVSINFLQFGS